MRAFVENHAVYGTRSDQTWNQGKLKTTTRNQIAKSVLEKNRKDVYNCQYTSPNINFVVRKQVIYSAGNGFFFMYIFLRSRNYNWIALKKIE